MIIIYGILTISICLHEKPRVKKSTGKKMNFMCCRHRLELSENPEKAIAVWSRLLMQAKLKFAKGNFREAAIACGNALDCAEITFEDNPVSGEVNRYLRTAVELIYIIRRGNDILNTEMLLNHVEETLQENLYPADVKLLTKPLQDVTYLPLDRVSNWMQILWDADKQLCRQLH